jgi:hypothetical protein
MGVSDAMLITQVTAKTHRAFERSLAPLGMTMSSTRYEIDSRCGKNIVRHLQAPPAFKNSVIGNSWHR